MTKMRRFTLYRRADLNKAHAPGLYLNPDEPTLEGCVFSDGTVAVRWLTIPSTSLWRNVGEFMRVHGHLEAEDYRTEIVWHDEQEGTR